MGTEWFYARDGEQFGPVTAETLRQMAGSGKLLPTDLLWREGFPQWVEASKTKLFAGSAAAARVAGGSQPMHAAPSHPPPQAAPVLDMAPEPMVEAPPPSYDTAPAPQAQFQPAAPIALGYRAPSKPVFESISSVPYYWIGAMLLIGFIFPIAAPGAGFINIQGIFVEGLPITLRIFLLYPLLAGVAAFFIAKINGPGRGISILVAAAIPLLLLLAAEDVAMVLRMVNTRDFKVVQAVFGGMAILGMLVGPWVFKHRAGHIAAAAIGAGGAAMYIITLFLPQETLTGGSTIGLLAPFKALGGSAPRGMPRGMTGMGGLVTFTAIMSIAQMALMIAAAVVLFLVIARREEPDAVDKAQLAFRLVLGAIGVVVLMMVVAMFWAAGNAPPGASVVGPLLTILIKFIAWLGGLAMMLPVGLTDLLVSVLPQPEQPVRTYTPRQA